MNQFFVERLTRPGMRADLDTIQRLNWEAFRQPGKMTLEQYETFLANPFVIFVVARDAKTREIIGKQTLHITTLDCCVKRAHLEQVVTDSRYQRCGIGKQIWDMLIKIARDERVHFIDWTSGSTKQSAQKFYDSMPGCERRNTNNFRYPLY